jgi:hypothetical protein
MTLKRPVAAVLNVEIETLETRENIAVFPVRTAYRRVFVKPVDPE